MNRRLKKAFATLFLVCMIATSASAATTRNRDTESPSIPKKIVRIIDQLRRLLLPSANEDIIPPRP